MLFASYQRLSYWFLPLFISFFLVTYQNCSDVGFKRMNIGEDPGGLACLPNDFNLELSHTNVAPNDEVDFWVEPEADGTTYTWKLNGNDLGVGPSTTYTFDSPGNYTMIVKAQKQDCPNIRTKTISLSVTDGGACALESLILSGDDRGYVGQILNYIVPHNCQGLSFLWDTADGSLISDTDHDLSHAWANPGVYVVSSEVTSPNSSINLQMPVQIQNNCPALDHLFVSAPDVAYVNDTVDFLLHVPGCLNLTSIQWSFGDGSSGSGINTSHVYTNPGVKNVVVEVTDISGAVITLPHTITILDDNPICDVETSFTLTGPTVGFVGESLRYGVFVPNCYVVSAINWNFGNSDLGAGNPVTQTYNIPGLYTVTAVVDTDSGQITLRRNVLILASADNYSWALSGYSDCNCEGQQQALYICVNTATQQQVDEAACPSPKPSSSRSCTADPIQCPGQGRYEYQVNWSACDALTCHTSGIETAELICRDTITDTVVDLSFCSDLNAPPLPQPRVCEAPNYPECTIDPNKYEWVATYGACNCDGNQNKIDQKCQLKENQSLVDPIYCDSLPPPADVVSCTPAANQCVTFSWKVGLWSSCSATACGTQGQRSRTVVCENSLGETVADSNCSQPKPASTEACSARTCNPCNLIWSDGSSTTIPHLGSVHAYTQSTLACEQSCDAYRVTRTCTDGALSGTGNHKTCQAQTCTYSWYTGAWSACSATACNTSGTQSRIVQCRNQNGAVVADNLCSGSKPSSTKTCSARACNACTANWLNASPQSVAHGQSVTSYASSSVACGQTCSASVRTCNDGTFNGAIQYKTCNAQSCPTYNWDIGAWTSCSSNQCGVNGNQTRSVVCRSSTGQVVSDAFCSSPKPASAQVCSPPPSTCACPSGTIKDGGSCVGPIALNFSRYSGGSPSDDKFFVSENWYSFVSIPAADNSFQLCVVKTPGDSPTKCVNGSGWFTVDWLSCNQAGQATCQFDGQVSQNAHTKTLRFKNLPGHVGGNGENLNVYLRRGSQITNRSYDLMPDVQVWLSKNSNGSPAVSNILISDTTYSFIKVPTVLVNNNAAAVELCSHIAPNMSGNGSSYCNIYGNNFSPYSLASQSNTTIYSQSAGATTFRITNAPGTIGAAGQALTSAVRISRQSIKNGDMLSYSVTGTCQNGATNYPSCNSCPSGSVYYNGNCVQPCSNGASNPPTCTQVVRAGCYIDTHAWDTYSNGNCMSNGCTATNLVNWSVGNIGIGNEGGWSLSPSNEFTVSWSGACNGSGPECSRVLGNGEHTATATVKHVPTNRTWSFTIKASKTTAFSEMPNQCPPPR